MGPLVALFLKNILGVTLKNLHIIVIIGVVGYLSWGQFHTIPKLQTEIKEAQRVSGQLRADFDTYKQNQANLNIVSEGHRTVVAGQVKIKERIREVPVATIDKPFNDPGMLERARRLREYQQTSPANEF